MRIPIISTWNYALIIGCTFALMLGSRSVMNIAEKDVRWTEGAHARATVLSRKGYGRWSEQNFDIRYRLDDVAAAGDIVLPGYDAILFGADARDFAVGTQIDARYPPRWAGAADIAACRKPDAIDDVGVVGAGTALAGKTPDVVLLACAGEAPPPFG